MSPLPTPQSKMWKNTDIETFNQAIVPTLPSKDLVKVLLQLKASLQPLSRKLGILKTNKILLFLIWIIIICYWKQTIDCCPHTNSVSKAVVSRHFSGCYLNLKSYSNIYGIGEWVLDMNFNFNVVFLAKPTNLSPTHFTNHVHLFMEKK